MSIEYFLFIFVASLAVLQASSAWQNLKFLLFLRSRFLTFILAILVIVATYYWFFYLGGKHVRETGGNKQLFLFPLAVLAGTAFTLFFSSLVNAGGKRQTESKTKASVAELGIEALKEMTYWQAVKRIFPR